MYYGESQTTLDEKGRISVPMQFRSIMEVHDHDVWFLCYGFDGSIFLFHKEQWTALLEQVSNKATLEPEMLDFRRYLLGSLAKVKRDKQGRLIIPSHLRDYAGIDREAVMIGVEDHLELWSRAGWHAFRERQAGSYKAMAAKLFGKQLGEAAETTGDMCGDEH